MGCKTRSNYRVPICLKDCMARGWKCNSKCIGHSEYVPRPEPLNPDELDRYIAGGGELRIVDPPPVAVADKPRRLKRSQRP